MPNKHSFAAIGNDIKIRRSTFDMPFRHLTTGNFGKCIPFYLQEVMPGDTFEMQTNMFVRMSTPLYPVMDDAYVEYNYFFVPMRLIWDRWHEFLGENKYTAWVNETEYIIPHAAVTPVPGDLYDHMEVPTYDETDDFYADYIQQIPNVDINILPARAYWAIWNYWYRNENTTDPKLVNTGDDVTEDEVQRYRVLANAAKPFDVFTSALPAPQKGEAVTFGMADVPVVTTSLYSSAATDRPPIAVENKGVQPGTYVALTGQAQANGTVTMNYGTVAGEAAGQVGGPLNLVALTSDGKISINELRQAFAMQRLLELQARTGTRATEIIAASFQVSSSDARLMYPQYLGGSTALIQMQQVVQQSNTVDQESPLGRLGAFSKTVSSNHDFISSFTEHGYVIGIVVARHRLTYQQGLAKHYSRRGRYDFYWPNFANIGEQPIKTKELYYSYDENDNENVFGYQEAWYEYRFKPNAVTGAFRSTIKKNLDEWHYADVYQGPPTLSTGWMNASDVNVDRTLAVPSSMHDQLLFDIQCNLKATRPMPLYSTPGFIDHF